MTRSRLLLLVLTLVLAVPPGLFDQQDAGTLPKSAATGLAAPQEVEPGSTGPTLDARKRGARKAKRRKARKAERKERRDRKKQQQNRRERKKDSQTSEQARIEALVEAAPPRVPALAIEDDPCGPGLIQLPKSGRCTHGPDPEPPASVLAAARNLEPKAPVALCDDDGAAQFRVQVLYLQSTSAQDRYSSSLSAIRAVAEEANAILHNSQPGEPEPLSYHFVRNEACQIEVAHEAIPHAALLDFDDTIQVLEQRDYDRVDRIYLMFADTSAAGICGIGTYWPDDRKTSVNYNNRGPSYSRVDRGCWDAPTAAHELMHNLGGVQDSAPHSTGYGHCFDEFDVMCYHDDPKAPPMQVVCTPKGVFDIRYDCNGDDYFNTAPGPGNYLSFRWNTADNWFLTQDIPDDVDLIQPEVTWVAPVGNGQTHVTGSSVIPLRVNATDASGIATVEFWLYDESIDDWEYLGEDGSAPYQSSVNLSQLRGGLKYLTADAFDSQGNWTDEGIWIQPAGVTATTSVTLVASTARVKARKRVTLTATVANPPASGTSIEFRVCRGGSCAWESGRSLGHFSGPTASTTWKAGSKGKATFQVQATSESGVVTSNPATVSVKKVKKKKRQVGPRTAATQLPRVAGRTHA